MVGTITPGYNAIVYVTDSTAAATFTTEATTQTGSGKIYTITDNAYDTEPVTKLIHPTLALTQNWSVTPTGPVIVNRLKNQVVSASNEGAKTLTLTGHYINVAPLLYCNDYSFSGDKTLIDETPFNSKYQAVRGSPAKCSGTLSNFFDATAVAGLSIAPYFTTQMLAEATFAIKLYVHANLSLLVWAAIDKENLKAAVDGDQEEIVGWHGVADAEGHVMSRL